MCDRELMPATRRDTVDKKKVCYVKTSKGTKEREVETGLFNDDFVEIKSGLAEGEKVLLNPPRWTASESAEGETEAESEQTEEEVKAESESAEEETEAESEKATEQEKTEPEQDTKLDEATTPAEKQPD